jgi:peptidoglycan/xylan/chitin deacetylase (PgdA/CDA1 family)
METAIGILGNEDFKDCTYFVSPYGSQDEGLQEIAKEHGLKCLVSISNDDYLRNDSQYTPYNIPRVGFNATDGGTSTMSRLKEHIDAVSVTGGWLLVGTHIYNGWTEALLETRFKEFVDYAKERGLKFVTLKEGFETYSKTSGNENFPYDPSAVDEVEQNNAKEIAISTYYDMMGRNICKPRPGLNIIRMSDGSAKKVLLR